VADRLKRSTEERGPGERMRRVVVKARIKRLRTSSRSAEALLRYLQRDGMCGEAKRGRFYGPQTDADGYGLGVRCLSCARRQVGPAVATRRGFGAPDAVAQGPILTGRNTPA
jgi:hypothetical protein